MRNMKPADISGIKKRIFLKYKINDLSRTVRTKAPETV
jgi:hypothetical protein